MRRINRILVVQTAFIGDVILTLPLVQVLKDFFKDAEIDILVVPRSAEVCNNHPSIARVISYDKHGKERGLGGFFRLVSHLRGQKYDVAFAPHRSVRSAALCFLSGISLRIGFSRSVGRFFFTKTVRYERDLHEIDRNLALLKAVGIRESTSQLPQVFPGVTDKSAVDKFLGEMKTGSGLIAIAPGTVWNTKRWLNDRFAGLAREFLSGGYRVVLVGGPEDGELCDEIKVLAGSDEVLVAAGKLSLLQSAELLRRCKLAVSNDSAPMHLSVAVGTPVVAIFGATIPEFGFGPAGPHDAVVEVRGLPCRPCSIHGGEQCPIKTFVCMMNITHDRVFMKAMDVIEHAAAARAKS